MKKYGIIVLVLAMLLSLAACGAKKDDRVQVDTQEETVSEQSEETALSTDETAEDEPSEENGKAEKDEKNNEIEEFEESKDLEETEETEETEFDEFDGFEETVEDTADADNTADVENLFIDEDDHTVVIQMDDTRMVFTHDGEKVTGYYGYIACESPADAEKKAAELNKNSAIFEQEEIKAVSTEGSYVVIEYTENAFGVTNYEELHAIAEQYKQLSK